MAVALLQFSRDFPETVFIGVDLGYDRTTIPDMGKPGVQLVRDNWASLLTIPDHSIDTFLSCTGAFTHGVYKGNPEASLQVIITLNRVAKPGAILRYNTDRGWSSYNEEDDDWTAGLLRKNGWEVYFSKESGTNVAIRKS